MLRRQGTYRAILLREFVSVKRSVSLVVAFKLRHYRQFVGGVRDRHFAFQFVGYWFYDVSSFPDASGGGDSGERTVLPHSA